MTDHIRAVTQDAYSGRSWKRFENYSFAAAVPVVPLSAAEIGTAMLSLPLAFVASGESLSLAAVLGLAPGQNLFVAPGGKWAGQYVPALLRSYPFKLAKHDNGDLTLCFDESSGLLADAGQGEAFFDEVGEPAEATQKILQFLVKVSQGQDAVSAAANLLNKHGVLEPWPLKIKDGESERGVGGLLRVSESTLNALEDEGYLELRRAGAMSLAYAQLLSMPNVSLLGELVQLHANYQQQALTEAEQKNMFQATGAEDGTIDWDRIFND